MELLAELVLLAHKETRVPLVSTEPLALKVNLDHMVTKVLKVLRVLEEKMERLDLPALVVFPETLVSTVFLAQKVQLVTLVQSVLLVFLVHEVLPARKETWVFPVSRVTKVSLDLLV